MFDDKDFEEEHRPSEDCIDDTTHLTGQSQSNIESGSLPDSDLKNHQPSEQEIITEEDKFEQMVLKVDEDYRDWYREARYYPDELYQNIFEMDWNKWQETKDYCISTRISERGLLCVMSHSTIKCKPAEIGEVLKDRDHQSLWDPNFLEGYVIKHIGEDTALCYYKTKKVAVVSSRD